MHLLNNNSEECHASFHLNGSVKLQEARNKQNYNMKNSCLHWDSNPRPARTPVYKATALSTKPDCYECQHQNAKGGKCE